MVRIPHADVLHPWNLCEIFWYKNRKTARDSGDGEDGFAWLRPDQVGCDMPPACRQEPPFESVLQTPKPTKRPIRKDWSFCGKLG